MITFMIGIVWQASSLSCIATLSILLLSFCICNVYLKSRQAFLWNIAFLLIATSGAFLHKKEFDDYDAFYHYAHNNNIEITGVVEDINQTIICNKKTTSVIVRIYTITYNNITKKNNKNILLYGNYKNVFEVGDTVLLSNVFCKKTLNEHMNQYQMREQIVAAVFNHNPADIKVINHPAFSIKRWIFNQKQKILCSCKHKLSSESFLFFSSLFLGNRSYVKDHMESVNEQFKRWGIFHFLARSGLHLALFIFTWNTVLHYIPLPFLLKQIVILLLSIVYALFSWQSAPFTRSLLLFLCNRACIITKNSYNLLHYLTVICFCFLLYSPLYLFFLDFQLTFGITFVLAWFNQLHGQHLYEQSMPQRLNY
jgi:predicted membrane metal-binding protein